MTFSLGRTHRLVARGEAGIACDEDGIALGAVHLVRASRTAGNTRRCEVRLPNEIDRILRTAYGPQPAGVASRIHRGLCRAAAWIEAGDLGRAGVETVGLGLPDLGPASMAKLAEVADLEKGDATAWQNEPRVPAGQAGGGQWSSGGGVGAPSQTKGPLRHVRPARSKPNSAQRRPVPAKAPQRHPTATPPSSSPSAANSLLIHTSTLAVPIGRPIARPLGAPDGGILPEVARLGWAGLVGLAMSLEAWTHHRQEAQIADAMSRFGLDPSRPADVAAANAYVWSRYNLSSFRGVPSQGPAFDAACETVMRFVRMYPGVFTRPNQKSVQLIGEAARAGVADYVLESARPPGVERKYQTTSASARAAVISETELTRDVAVHHLIPPNIWKQKLYLVKLADWKVDNPDNLIILPRTPAAQARMGGILPIHDSRHRIYDQDTIDLINSQESVSKKPITPDQANKILGIVCKTNEIEIRSGHYGKFLRVGF